MRPTAAKHRLRISAFDAGGGLVDVTLPLHQVVGHRAVFTYKPATEEDAQVVLRAGGLFRAPASIVEVVPVVRVDGRERAAGRAGWGERLTRPAGVTTRSSPGPASRSARPS